MPRTDGTAGTSSPRRPKAAATVPASAPVLAHLDGLKQQSRYRPQHQTPWCFWSALQQFKKSPGSVKGALVPGFGLADNDSESRGTTELVRALSSFSCCTAALSMYSCRCSSSSTPLPEVAADRNVTRPQLSDHTWEELGSLQGPTE